MISTISAARTAALPQCNIAKCAARGAIEQYPISSVTEPSAQSRKPEIFGLALRPSTAKWAGDLAIDPGAVEIRLGAKHRRVGLEPQVEIAGRPAAGIDGIAPNARAEAVAEIEAEIDPAPVIDG